MKACIIQPPYSRDLSLSDEYFDYKLARLAECDDSLDIIVLPEYSDVPCATETLDDTVLYHERYIDRLMTACAETARRCHALVFVNAMSWEVDGWRNTTFTFGRDGVVLGKYFKRHLPPLEKEGLSFSDAYISSYTPPYTLDIEGVRYGFLTCYDFYFYEAFPTLAREYPDVLIGCSLQRSDSHDAIEIMCRFLAYNTNAYVLRSSVSFDEHATVCGGSMAVTPKGDVLGNMKGRFGSLTVEFDPHDKYYKPAGYGNPPAAHHEYIEYGRRPWQYRNGGAAIVPFEADMPYPRLCAHRGFSAVAPENSLPAFGAAVALGASEIELDVWPTADGVMVSLHDPTLDRVSDGCGNVYEKTLAELKGVDFGKKFSETFAGLPIATFEEVLQRLGGQTVMNIHVKPFNYDAYPEEHMKTIVALVRQYDCTRHVYFMLETDVMLRQFAAYAPDIPRCVGQDFNQPWAIVDRAIEAGAQKVQFFKPYLNRDMVEKAHAHGIRCNVFFANDPAEAQAFLDMGVDTILTDNYQVLSHTLGLK